MIKDTALPCAVLRSRAAHPLDGERLGDADWPSGQPDREVTTGQSTKLGDPGPAPVSALTGEYCPSLRLSC